MLRGIVIAYSIFRSTHQKMIIQTELLHMRLLRHSVRTFGIAKDQSTNDLAMKIKVSLI